MSVRAAALAAGVAALTVAIGTAAPRAAAQSAPARPAAGAPLDDAAIRRILVQIKRGQDVDANLALLRGALDQRADPGAFARDVGVALLAERLYEPAQSFLEIARSRFPNDGLIAQQLGNAHVAQFHYAEAYEHLTAAEKLLPAGPRPMLHQFLSMVSIGLQRDDEALARANRAIEEVKRWNAATPPGAAKMDEVDFLLNLANVHQKFRRPDAALQVVDSLDDAKLEPRDRAKAWLVRAQILDERGDEPGALAAFLRQREIAPGDPAGAYELALFHVRRNRPADARPHLEHAIRLDPEHEGAHFNLARCLLRLGERDRGRDVMERYEQIRDARLAAEIRLAAFRLELLDR